MKLRRRPAEARPSEVALTAADHLAQAVRVATVTPASDVELTEPERAVFDRFRALLEELYPVVFATATVEVVGRAGLLLHVPGTISDRPVVLMAHQDVVPVGDDWAEQGWEYEPFAGVIADGRVHGRGTLDDKGALIVLMEAVESLLAAGWTPARDMYLLFGADEESYGQCAVEATLLLESRGVEPWLVVDEGGAVASGVFPGISRDVAVIGASEKGLLTVELVVESLGGHASTPPRRSAPGILARALVEIEEHPFPGELHDISVEMFESVAVHMRGPRRVLLSRARSLRGLLARVLPRLGPEMAAMVRTTAAITQLAGSPAHNVLATHARAVVNLRVAVGSTTAGAVEYLRSVIDDDGVEIRVVASSEPSPVSPTGDDDRWLALGAAVAQAYPDAVVAPYVMMAASDARHLARISPAVYRFSPLRMDATQRAAVHGPNENVEIDSLGSGVEFYRALLTGPALGPAAPAAST